jgi:hypothetical protein
MGLLEDVRIRLGLDKEAFLNELKLVPGQVQSKLAQSMGDLGRSIGKGLAGYVGFEYVKNLIDKSREIVKIADSLGISVTFFKSFRAELDKFGYSEDRATEALFKLSNMIGEARAGVDTSRKVFDKYGISLINSAGNAKSLSEVLIDIKRLLGNTIDAETRSAIATDFFSARGAKLGSILANINIGLGELNLKFGLFSTEAAIRSMARLGDAMNRLKRYSDAAVAVGVGSIVTGWENLGRVLGLASIPIERDLKKVWDAISHSPSEEVKAARRKYLSDYLKKNPLIGFPGGEGSLSRTSPDEKGNVSDAVDGWKVALKTMRQMQDEDDGLDEQRRRIKIEQTQHEILERARLQKELAKVNEENEMAQLTIGEKISKVGGEITSLTSQRGPLEKDSLKYLELSLDIAEKEKELLKYKDELKHKEIEHQEKLNNLKLQEFDAQKRMAREESDMAKKQEDRLRFTIGDIAQAGLSRFRSPRVNWDIINARRAMYAENLAEGLAGRFGENPLSRQLLAYSDALKKGGISLLKHDERFPNEHMQRSLDDAAESLHKIQDKIDKLEVVNTR